MILQSYVDPISKLLGDWAGSLNEWSVIFRLLTAFVCAALIGCERARKRHSAGLRTFILVSVGAASAMLLDLYCISKAGITLPFISAAALIGAAILASNSLLYSSKNQIKGLTTSVALWASAFIGLASGAGFYVAALSLFVLLILCLSVLPNGEKFLKDKSNHFEIHLELKNRSDLYDFITTLRKIGMKIDDIEANPAYLNSGLAVYTVSITITRDTLKKYKSHDAIIEALSTLDYVSFIGEII